MNVEARLKTKQKIPLENRTVIHILLVNNMLNEKIKEALKPYGISMQQFNVLRILRGQKGKPANLATLNERMISRMSNTTRLVDKLLIKGYVDRVVCPSNRRKVEISLTSLGAEALLEMDDVVDRTEKSLVKNFNKEELESLNQLLNKF